MTMPHHKRPRSWGRSIGVGSCVGQFPWGLGHILSLRMSIATPWPAPERWHKTKSCPSGLWQRPPEALGAAPEATAAAVAAVA
eukprot:CAMPEP_0174369258 /NCGR_PEP_ID=MMETSP0811_2-20130205/91840_1 /TAXON_ID=73025 ORGANISM="Eutreptiella gymnastica-like, Strain CCMP1594" /NCGR_SAMPLE_ID=MMETSP0811_2 /ASSEMBLY_ACC=CAM_ASM_000667 /LENGTH=82 /DNA_ID=CAMNT_0015513507 /DNA_START=102 /DNA_END=347 /DNA_ORIENTATION=-